MKSVLPTAAVVIGVVLLAVSLIWAMLFPASRGWTEEKSRRLTDLGNQATEIQLQIGRSQTRPSMHSGENPAELQEKLEKVNAEYKELYEEFRSATETPKSASRYLKWSGIAFVIAGALVVFATRSA